MMKTQDFNAYWLGWLLFFLGFLMPLSTMADEVTVADSNGNVLRYQFTADGPATFVGVKTYSADADKAGRIIIADQVTDTSGGSHDVLYISGSVGNRSNIVSIVFGQNIIATGGDDGSSGDAFYNCNKLESVTLNSKLQILGRYTFQSCHNLSTINLAEATSLTTIMLKAFENADCLRSITIPSSVTTIDDGAFGSIDSLRTVTFAAGSKLTEMGNSAFTNNPNLESINLQTCNLLTTLPNYVLYDCKSLKSLTLSDALETVGNGAFQYCHSMKELTFGTALTSLSDDYYVVYGCDSLQKVTLPGVNYPFKRSYAFPADVVLYVHPDLVDVYRSNEFSKACHVIGLGEINDFVITTTAGGELQTKVESIGAPNNLLTLTVTGPLNGTDIDYIHSSMPNIQVLNLTDASIVEGGDSYHQWNVDANGDATIESYYGPWNTENNVVTRCMFYNMPTLRSISLPKGITKIGEYALAQDRYQNFKLAHIGIPAGVTTIDKYAFNYAGITEVTIPSGVTRIEEQTFANCRKLKKATLPDGITYIGNSAFSECHALEDVNIPANIETIDQYAFNNNKVRTSPIVLPATLKSIGYRAFSYNSKVESITFSEGLETISGYAFSNCNAVKSLVLPESITKLEYNAFEGCDSITEFRFPANIKQVPDGILYHCDKLERVTLADGTTRINNYAFQDCPNLTSMNITEQTALSYIGIYAFANTGFTTVTLPNSITTLDYCAFRECKQLTSINVPTLLTSVPYDFVANCPKLASVQMHDGIRVVGHNAFIECKALPAIELNDQITSIEYNAFNGCENLVLDKLPTALTHIGDAAFRNTKKITGKLTIPVGVNTIGGEAFRESGLTGVVLPEGVTQWGTTIFYNCTSLKEVRLPKDIKRITNYMFQRCTALEQIQIPDSVKEIGYAAFDQSGIASIQLPDSLEKLEDYALANTQLRSIRIPDGVKGDQPGSYVCAGSKHLKEAYMGRNQDYTTITNFTFFDNCDSLQLLRIYAGMPPRCYSGYMDYRKTCVLEVPEDAVDLYKETDIWKEFKEINGYFDGELLNDLDFAILKCVYNKLDGANWKKPWDLTNNHRSMGKWQGVVTVGDYITSIDLSGQGLKGALPDSLFLLPKIEVLNLSDNRIKADLTTLLAKVPENTTLSEVNLMGNELTGDIYPFAAKLTHLTKLNLSYNQLTAVSQVIPNTKLSNNDFLRGFQFVDYQTKQVVEGAPVTDITPGVPVAIEFNTLQSYRHEYGDYGYDCTDLYRHYINKNGSWTTSDWELERNGEKLWTVYAGWYNRPLRAPKGVPVMYTHGDPWWSHLSFIVRFDWTDGDVNADQTVDITDLQSVVYYALNDNKADGQIFNFTTADANNDDIINVSDIVGSVDYVLNYVEPNPSQAPSNRRRAPSSLMNTLSLDGDNAILTHANAVAALQLTVTGAAMGQLHVSEALKSRFSVAMREVAGGIRVVVWSTDGHTLEPGIHQLLTDLPASAVVTDIRLSDVEARYLDVLNEGGTTSLSVVKSQLSVDEVPVFDLSGRHLGTWDTLPEGIYVIRVNGKQYKVKK